jgi:ABC-type transport system involved in cytochrome bd biosynthesis fused ATPase/permease subunit
MRYRIKTLMLLVTICALVVALWVQGRRANQREANLRAAVMRAETSLVTLELNSAVAELTLQELQTAHKQELSRVRSQMKEASDKATNDGRVGGKPSDSK